jgi:hypothetical protein
VLLRLNDDVGTVDLRVSMLSDEWCFFFFHQIFVSYLDFLQWLVIFSSVVVRSFVLDGCLLLPVFFGQCV